jgi:predicted signal transduction protein with EAL and GGDEF domain
VTSRAEWSNGGSLLDELPDLVVMLARDGTLISFCGGRSVSSLHSLAGLPGQRLDQVWPTSLVNLLKQLVQRAIASRGTVEARIQVGSVRYEIRVTASGPDRAICVLRLPTSEMSEESQNANLGLQAPYMERPNFFVQLQESLAIAALRERSISFAFVHVEGLADILRLIDSKISERIFKIAVQRFLQDDHQTETGDVAWYMSQLGDQVLVILLETSDREIVEALLNALVQSLQAPIQLGDTSYHLNPCVGVALLGQDGGSQEELIQNARAAAVEARRAESTRIVFFTDALELRSLERMDMARELREAIAKNEIRLRYTGRYDLETGQLHTLVGYVNWNHPLRGTVRPAAFLRLADATGLSLDLSRSIFSSLRADMVNVEAQFEPHVRISFGPLRHHVLNAGFLDDIKALLADGAVSTHRIELRIAERAYLSGGASLCSSLAMMGLQLVVDEVGRDLSSFELLARAPVWGLQLDRSWVAALNDNTAAMKVCRAAMGVAHAFDLIPIATGVDGIEQRDALIKFGCAQGMGDFYEPPGLAQSFTTDTAKAAAR